MVATAKASALPRAAYPGHILFVEQDGLYWLEGHDLQQARRVLGFECCEQRIGFDSESASYYVQALLEQGKRVGIVQGNSVRALSLRGGGDRSKGKSTTIGLAPELLLGTWELERLCRQLTRKSSADREVVERLRAELSQGKATADLGTLYVYQVCQDMYEVEAELTTIPQAVVEALAVAAHLAGKMLRCQLVEPKPRRKHGRAPKPVIVVSEPVQYGQLRLLL